MNEEHKDIGSDLCHNLSSREHKSSDLPNSSGVSSGSIRARQLRPFYLRQWLDVKDTEGSWLEAQIVDIDKHNENRFKVHYKGFKDKYDEWLCGCPSHPDSARIAPVHSRSASAPSSASVPSSGVVELEVKCGEGVQLDVKDSTDKWLVGEVIEVDHVHDMVKIRYAGWDEKHDEWINMESYRLKPLSTHTHPNMIAPRSLAAHNHPSHPSHSSPSRPHITLGADSAALPTQRLATSDNERNFQAALRREKGFAIEDMKNDGNCLFRAVSHQVYGNADHHDMVREKCMELIQLEKSFFQNYIAENFDQYVQRMKRSGEWGDHVEIQAMSRLYDRPVEIYAYNTTPLKTHLGRSNGFSSSSSSSPPSPPIRLSYHFQSHYNSVVPPDHLQHVLAGRPGEFEDSRLQSLRLQPGQASDLVKAQRLSDAEATDMEQLRLALGLSQADFNSRNRSALDSIVGQSLKDFNDKYERDLLEAQRRSEMEAVEGDLIQQTIQMSEDELLKKARDASMSDQGASLPVDDDALLQQALAASIVDEEAQMKQALAASQGLSHAPIDVDDDIKRVMQESMLSSLPGPVKQCVTQGFSMDEAVMAYSIFGTGERVSEETVAQNMLNYLQMLRSQQTIAVPQEQKWR